MRTAEQKTWELNINDCNFAYTVAVSTLTAYNSQRIWDRVLSPRHSDCAGKTENKLPGQHLLKEQRTRFGIPLKCLNVAQSFPNLATAKQIGIFSGFF